MIYWITDTLLFILVTGFLFLSAKAKRNLIDQLRNQKVDTLEKNSNKSSLNLLSLDSYRKT